MEKKLYIGGIPADMDEMGLAQLVGVHGDIATLTILRDKLTRKGKGIAFVEMVSEEGAAAAAALIKTELDDKILDVKPAEVKQVVQPPVKYERVQRVSEPQKI